MTLRIQCKCMGSSIMPPARCVREATQEDGFCDECADRHSYNRCPAVACAELGYKAHPVTLIIKVMEAL